MKSIKELMMIVEEASADKPMRVGDKVKQILSNAGFNLSYWHLAQGKKGYVWTMGTARGLGVMTPTEEQMKKAERLLKREFGKSFVDIRIEIPVNHLPGNWKRPEATSWQTVPFKVNDKGLPKTTVVKVRFSPDLPDHTDLKVSKRQEQ